MPVNNEQPSLVVSEVMNLYGIFPSRSSITSGDSDYIGQVNFYAFNFAPRNTALAQGQLLSIQQNTALFSILGTTYGGNGQTTFELPNLAGRRAIGDGQGPGLNWHVLGEEGGLHSFDVVQNNLLPRSGGNLSPIDNESPYLTMHWMIQVEGVFPSQSGITNATTGLLGTVSLFAGNFTTPECLPCDGRLLSIADYSALYAIIGTTYGGDGISTFALPDLQGRSIVGVDNSHPLGSVFGTETVTLGSNNMPGQMGGSGTPINNDAPSLAMNYLIALTGIFPSQNAISNAPTSTQVGDTYLGEIIPFAGNFAPTGFALCQGQILSIAQNQALFALLGTMYGGNGVTTFALPDLRGRTITGSGYEPTSGHTYSVGEVYGSDTATVTMADIPGLSFTGSGTLYGGDQSDSISGQSGDDIIHGNGGNDALYGYGGNDTLDGGTGADAMTGGLGNDTYYVDNGSDTTVENVGEGTDTVLASVNYTIGANIEILTLTGSAVTGTGNAQDNTITGNSLNDTLYGLGGNDWIDGGAGNDTMYGGTGDDTYVVYASGDVVVENANEGTDTVRAGMDYTLGANVENLILVGTALNGNGNSLDNSLTGNGYDNVLKGWAGNDTINGGAGADTMYGGTGDDTFTVDNTGDVVIEYSGEGTDTVLASVTYSLAGTFVENLTLTGSAAINATGNGLANTLTGNNNNNILDGGLGADTMTGGLGNDTYYVDNAGDVVVENAGGGSDLVYSSVTYSLNGTYAEALTLTGTANINATGNTQPNILTGNSGNNVLDGKGGADTMAGGKGDDTYYVDAATDVVIENAGEGTDLINSTVSYSLAGIQVENLTLIGSAAINATGNGLANVLVGNGAANILDGGYGGDTMTGGGGADTFLFNGGGGADTITDFSSAQGDTINLNALTHGVIKTYLISQVGADVHIDFGGGNVITVLNTTNDATFQSHIVW